MLLYLLLFGQIFKSVCGIQLFPTLVTVRLPFSSLFYVDVLNCQNYRKKIPACLLEYFFHILFGILFQKKHNLGLYLSAMSLYRTRKKLHFKKMLIFLDTLFQCKIGRFQNIPMLHDKI